MKVWSKSKKAHLEIVEMNTVHLTNLKAKILRGDYEDADGEPLSAYEYTKLVEALDAELQKRAESEGSAVEG